MTLSMECAGDNLVLRLLLRQGLSVDKNVGQLGTFHTVIAIDTASKV